MNIVVISHTYIAPINRKKWQVLALLHPDVNLTVIIPHAWPSTMFNHVATIVPSDNLPNCTFVALDVAHAGNEILYTYKPRQLFATLRAAHPDLIQVEQGASAACYAQANIIARLVNRKVRSIFFTWINWEQRHSLKHRLLFTPLEKLNLASAHGAITGNHDAKILLAAHGFKHPIAVIPQLGVDTDHFTPNRAELTVRKRIGFIGRLVEEKGILLLVEAFADLAHRFPDWDLAFIGSGSAREQLWQTVLHHNLQERVALIDPLPHEQMATFLNSTDILVLPSYDTPVWREQFGHVLIEAMACGVPVIGSSAGEISHVIDTAGLVFTQKNTADLLAQLQTLMQDEGLRRSLAQLGLDRARTVYSHQAIAAQTYAFWQHIMGTKENV